MAATLHDTSLGTVDGSGTDLSASDALTVTAGDLVVAGFKWEGADGATAILDTGASTPEFSVANAAQFHEGPGDLSGGVWYWIATDTGTVTVRARLTAARTFRKIKAYSFTPGTGTTLELGNVAAVEGLGTAYSAGSASAIAAGVATVFFHLYGPRDLQVGAGGWAEAAEFTALDDAQGTEYQFQTGAGSLTGDGSGESPTVYNIAQLAIFDEAELGGEPSTGPVGLISQRNRRHIGRAM